MPRCSRSAWDVVVQVIFCVCRENLNQLGFGLALNGSVAVVVRASDVQHPPGQLLHATLGAASSLSDKTHSASTSHAHPSIQIFQNAFRDRIHILPGILPRIQEGGSSSVEPQVELHYPTWTQHHGHRWSVTGLLDLRLPSCVLISCTSHTFWYMTTERSSGRAEAAEADGSRHAKYSGAAPCMSQPATVGCKKSGP